jgi:hypothetical protein
MLYNQIVHTAQVSIQNPAGGPNVVFASAPATTAPTYGLGFGQMPTAQDGHAGHVDVPANGAVQIGNLLTCAAVTYIYTNAMGAVQNVVLYHAHTGFIPANELPTDPSRNVHNVAAGQIHVVFCSSQSMAPNPNNGIQTAADGLIGILNAGVPAGNIRVLTGCGGAFGANSKGEVGMSAVATWSNGNLQTTLVNCANLARAAYAAQFPPGQTKLGLLGSSHNLANGQARIQTLTTGINAAGNDTARLNSLQTFLGDAHSFKPGSLKLFMVQQLNVAIRHQPAGNITPMNAQAQGNAIVSGVRNGTL